MVMVVCRAWDHLFVAHGNRHYDKQGSVSLSVAIIRSNIRSRTDFRGLEGFVSRGVVETRLTRYCN